MATKLKDSATAEKAALNLNTGIEAPASIEPNAPREKTTSERLFPDFMTSDGAIVNRPVVKDVPATETVAPVVQTQTPQTQAPTAPIYIKPEDMVGKMARLKVDGVEQDVPAEDLFKVKQLERHSISQLEMIAKERAQFEREKQEFLTRPTEPTKPTKQEPPVKKSAEFEALEAQMAQMRAEREQERLLLLPQIQEAGIKRVSEMIKERTGFDDYRSYHDKVKELAVAEAQKAQAAGDINAAKFFDSDTFYSQKYQELKLRDLAMKTSAPVPNPTTPVLQTQQGAPVLVNNAGQPVSIPTFESSSGVPSRTSDGQDWQSTYNRLRQTAQQNPTDENWMNFIRHKMRSGE